TYEDVVDSRNGCGVGTVIREWTATDASGNTGTCRQTINFGSIDPPTIRYPGDYEADCFVDPISLTPDVTGEVTFSGNDDCVQYAVGSDDLFLDDCAPYGYKIRRTWTIVDWCDPQFEETQDQIIKIIDDEAPVISCPADFTVSLRHNDCFTNVSLPQTSATDNCDFNVSIERELLDANGNVIPTVGVPVGNYRGRYIAEDACGNTDTCFINISIIDPVAPVVVTFQRLTVSLTAGGWAYLCADQVDDGSNDNCTGVGIYIRREDDEAVFNGYYQNFIRNNNCVRFQCRDLGENQVQIRVYDDADGDGVFGPVDLDGNTQISAAEEAANGDNWNESWSDITVEDKLPPVLVCPPDISLNCLTDFDDLEITGEAEADLNCDREDPTYTDVVPHGYCPDSDIIRTWRVEKRLAGEDGVEGTADDLVWVRSCEQVITITDDTPVTIEKLPLDITIDCTGGAVGTDPDDLTKFNFFDDYLNTPQNPGDDSLVVFDNPVLDYDCEHIGINYEDQPFGLCLPGSYKIRRNWTVIDWCDDNFEVTYTNVILVDDKEPPVLTVNNPGTVLIENNDDQCREFADITASAFDLCSNVTITNNSPYGPGTHDASGVYPKGLYTITFTAVDGCGNVATEEITVNVVDGKAPTAICTYGLSIGLKASCDVVLPAYDLDANSEDNCTDQANLTFEIARVDANGDLVDRAEDLTFTCDDLGNQRVALIVIDDAGNEAICETVVQVQQGSCTDPECDDNTVPPTLSVTGSISKENGDQVNGVEIFLDGNAVNQANGGFGMLIDKDEQTGMAYGVIEALKEDVVDNGVSTIDLVTIRRAILQLGTLSDYQNIAADITNDENVSTRDMIEIRRAILKQIDEFSQVPSWRFVPADHQFAGETWSTPVPFVYEVETSADEMEINFVAIKMGDVTGDADVNSSRSFGTFDIEVADAVMNRGEEVEVTMTSAQLSEVLGYQFTLGFDASSVELVDITGDVADYNFNLDRVSQGMIAVSKVTEEVTSEDLFTLTFRALENASISEVLSINSEITRAEAYDAGSSRLDVELSFVNDAADYALYQNVPNPFTNRTTIGFNMAEAGQATITVLDITGKVVFTTTQSADQGRNTVTVDRGQLNSSGIMYYQLEAGDFVATKKMIMIK
ncbi:MAG TPA: T9SS type A sorting domain-containing protein, partial [Saprospiraceae bacterium]|nr:T9SS type A sorting domain-containing protein [Saprospiraceae bacterium]